jgi:hypothetical protein
LKKIYKFARFISVYIDCDVKVHNVIRSAFDEIDALKRGGHFLKASGRGRWFNKADLQKAELRSFLLSDFPNLSPKAREILRSAPQGDLPDDKRLVCEHVVPCGVLEKLLREEHRKTPLTPDHVLEFHDRFYRRCIVAKEEDDQLSRLSMPKDWTPEDSLFARYLAAGFKWAESME